MTTIAYRNGVMACDSCISGDSLHWCSVLKIVRLKHGGLLGCAGDADVRDVVTLFNKVRSKKNLPTRKELAATCTDFSGILVLGTSDAYYIDISQTDAQGWNTGDGTGITPALTRSGFAAVGSGASLALAAMAAGADATTAVKIACDYDIYSKTPVHTVKLK